MRVRVGVRACELFACAGVRGCVCARQRARRRLSLRVRACAQERVAGRSAGWSGRRRAAPVCDYTTHNDLSAIDFGTGSGDHPARGRHSAQARRRGDTPEPMRSAPGCARRRSLCPLPKRDGLPRPCAAARQTRVGNGRSCSRRQPHPGRARLSHHAVAHCVSTPPLDCFCAASAPLLRQVERRFERLRQSVVKTTFSVFFF